MSRNQYTVLILVLVVYVLTNFFLQSGLMAYLFPSICWGILALATLKICGFQKILSWFNKRVFLMAALIGIFQIIVLIDAGLITGFGRSPQTFTPRGLMITAVYALSPLLGMELSRAYLLKTLGRKKPFLLLGLLTLLYSLITMSIISFIAILTSNNLLRISEFMGSTLLPTVAENLMSSYLALLAGPIASLAYRAPLITFQWFSPILPDLTWGFESLIGVMAPTIGFIVISQMTTLAILTKAGLKAKAKPKRLRRFAKRTKSPFKSWTIITLLCVLMVWASTGLLGFYPTVVASGSMRPIIDVGDVAIVISADPSEIRPGDIIQYLQEGGEMILHRVIHMGEDARFFQTKGDNNPVPDMELVLPEQIRGKLIFTIPKLGWLFIYIKTAAASVWSLISTSTMLAYAMLTAIALISSIYTIRTYKSRPHRHWQRRKGR